MLRRISTIVATLSVLGLVLGVPMDADAQGKSGEKGKRAEKGEKANKGKKADEADRGKAEKTKGKKAQGEKPGEGDGDEADEKAMKGKKGEKAGKGAAAAKKKGPDFDKKTSAELEKHAERVAKIQRIRELAQEKDNEKLLETAKTLGEKERKRHTRAMERLGYEPGEISGEAKGKSGAAEKGRDMAEKGKAKKGEKAAKGGKGEKGEDDE